MSQRGGQQYISNQFDKIRVLGKGSFGTATVHRRRADCTLVVLKEIDLSKFHSEQQRSSAIQEARIMSKLNHNNIIKYYNAYTTDSKLIIEMEYASIGTLQAYLSFQSQLLDEQEILVIFRQIGSGLSYLHSKGIIHLDLKMANIFITIEGLVKIGDFGIAQFMQSSQSALSDQSAPKNKKGCKKRPTNNDNNSHQLGTLAYSSPERCLGNQTDFKSDIWSLGCILYELITSKPLFSASSLPELVLSITRIQYQPIKRIVSPALTDIFTQTISREPIDRPTAEDLVCLTDQLLSRLQFHKQRSLMMQTKQHRPNHHRFDLSTDAACLGLANREPDSSPSINYPHSLVYQVRLDTRHIQVDRVNLPQTKRIKEICKGKSHYLVLTYDSVVYGWGSRNIGQLGACNLTSSSSCTNPNDFNAGVSSGRALNRISRSARNSMNARDWQLAQGQQLHSTPPSLASSAHTLISTPSNHNQQQQPQHPLNTHQVRAANQILSKQLVMSMLEKSQPVSRPFVLNELNNRKIIQVAAGNDFSVFLSRTGIVLTCGEGSTGCLGRGDFQSCFVPCMVDSLLNCDVVSVSCGPKHVVAVCGNGRVFAWGKWTGGRLGVSIGPGNSTIISNGATMGTTSYKASKRHSALASNQTVIGKYVVRPQLVEFPDDVFIKSAYCCDRGTIFIDSNDQCWACGSNRFNKLGLDIKRRFKRTIIVEQCWLPTEIQALSKYKIISCSIGKNHSSFITTEGKSLILGHDIDHSHRLRSNIVDNRLSHRRISSQLQTNRHKRKSWLQEQHQQTLQANTRTGQPVLSQSTGDMNKNLPHYKELTRSMLHHDQLSSFKKEEEATTTTSPKIANVPKYKVKRLYRQQIDSYLRQSRGMRKMPFECVLGVNCTSKFTLAMTNDNRIYFWGTRSYEKGEPCLSSMYLDCCTRTKHNVDSIEPQLISSSSDECFIKIGSTNSPLMSIIQTLGSDQPIIHAQDPRLTADSLADLWILDYRPSDSSSSSSSSSCCSSSVSNSSLSSVCSCRSTCSCDCSQLAPNVRQQNLLDSDNEDDDCTKHDAILEPQPILSLYVPSMFNHNTSALRLVKLFCFDEDRFYLVLDTTVKLQASSFSRPISRSPRIAHQTNRGQHQQQPSSPKLKLNILRESLTLDVDRQRELAANETKSASTRNLVSRTPPIGLTQNGNSFQPPADQNLPLADTSIKQPDEIGLKQTNDFDCKLGMDDSDTSDASSDEPAPEDQTNNTNTEGSCTTSNTPTPVNNTNNSAFSLEEPRSLSTFAAPMGNHIIVTPRMKSLDQNSQQLQPLEFNQPSMDHLEEGDEEAASSQEASSRFPMAMIGSPSVASNGRSHLSVRGRRRRARLQTKSESTTFTGEDVDETSSMPSWVRNEYIQQNQSPTSDNEHLFAIESSANEDTVCGLESDREETLATITNYTQMQPVEETLALGTDQNEQPRESEPLDLDAPHVSDEPAGGGSALGTSPIEGPSSTIMRRNISMSQPDISSKRHQQDQVNPILLSYRRASAVAADEAVVSQQNGCNLLDCYVYKLSSANHPSQSKIGCSYQSSYVNSIVSSGSVNPLIKTLDLSELNGERRELLAEMPMKASLDMDGEDEAHSLPNVARESMVLANGAHQMDNVSASMAEVSAVSGRENNSMTAGTLALKHQVIVSNGNDRNHSMPSASSEMLNINTKTSQTNELGTFLSRSALLYNQEQQVLLLQRERQLQQQQQHHMPSYQRNKTGSCSSINSLRRSFAKLFC